MSLHAHSGNSENEWFLQHEKVMLEQAALRRQHLKEEQFKSREAHELEAMRETHWMKCPKCGHDLNTIEMEGIEVDKCGFCGGIYFDRGEIDTLLLRDRHRRQSFWRRLFHLD